MFAIFYNKITDKFMDLLGIYDPSESYFPFLGKVETNPHRTPPHVSVVFYNT